jgi:hypothetical protein
MPCEDRFRFDDDERRSPPGPDTREPDPEEAVGTRKARPAPTGSLKHLKLVTQGEQLKLQRDL